MVNIIKDQEYTIEEIRREIQFLVEKDPRLLAKSYVDLVNTAENHKNHDEMDVEGRSHF